MTHGFRFGTQAAHGLDAKHSIVQAVRANRQGVSGRASAVDHQTLIATGLNAGLLPDFKNVARIALRVKGYTKG